MSENIDFVNFIENIPLPLLCCNIETSGEKKSYEVKYISKSLAEILKMRGGKCNQDILDILPIFKEERYNKELFDNNLKQIKRFIPEINNWMCIKKQFIGGSKLILYFAILEYDYNYAFELTKPNKKFYIIDKDDIYLHISNTLCEEIKFEYKSLVGKSISKIWGSTNLDILKKYNRKVLLNKEDKVETLIEYKGKILSIKRYFIYDGEEYLGEIGSVSSIVKKDIDREYDEKDMLRIIENYSPDNIFLKDMTFKFVGCNSSFEELLCIKKEEIIGKTVYDIPVFKHIAKRIDTIDKEIIEKKEKKIYEVELEMNNQKLVIETMKIPFCDNDENIIGIAGISRDVSKRKLHEEEIEKMRLDFYANLSHELKTPIYLIVSALQVIEKNQKKILKENKTLNRNMKIIKQNGNRILRLVDNIINLTKIESGYVDLRLQNEDIVYFIEDICMSVALFANQNNIELIFDTEIEEFVMAFDLEKMERIMLNLLSNSIKYNKENGKIYVILSKDDKNIKIKVKDSGVGIPKEKINKIFDRFEQVDNNLSRKVNGSGIGLSLVKSLAELHEGSVNVKSEFGVGTEFLVEIPTSLKESNDLSIHAEILNDIESKMEIEFSDI